MTTKQPNGIELRFLKLKFKDFITEYDMSLAMFIELRRHRKNWDVHPKDAIVIPQMEEEEKLFLRLILKYLYERNEEIKRWKTEILHDEFKEHHSAAGGTMDDEEFFEYLEVETNEGMTQETLIEYSNFNFKLNYLISKARNLGFTINLDDEITFNELEKEKEFNSEFIDAKGSEKLVYLKETGIIDFLKEQNPDVSQNKLAKLLSVLTGERHLQPGLNSMESTSQFKDRKNPYYSSKTAPKVQEQLTQWGFKIKNRN